MQKYTGQIHGAVFEVAADGTLSIFPVRVPDVWRDDMRLQAAPEFLASRDLPADLRAYWRAVSRVEVRGA